MVKSDISDNMNKVEKKDIDFLLKEYSVKDIETSLIKIFLEANNFKTKNELLLEVLRKNHNDIKEKIKIYLNERNIRLDLKTIERCFELLIETEDRKLNGSFYTPTFVVDYIVNETIFDDKKICDLSCGSGAFLIGAIQKINQITKKPIINIIEENIFGADISQVSIYRSKILLSLLALLNNEDKKEIKFNLIRADSLNYDWVKNYPEKFDVVIGNPPYVRIQNMPEKSREDIKKKYFTASQGNIDLFIPFIELGIKLIKEDGILGYIIPNSYFSSFASKKLREFLKENKSIKKIVDFNHLQIFNDVTTYTCITILDKKKKDFFNYALIHNADLLNKLKQNDFSKITFNSLSYLKWTLLEKDSQENIKRIENSGIKLGDMARISTGVATLRDDLYLIEKSETINGFLIKSFNGIDYKIEPEITREIIKAGILKSEKDIKENQRKIIFPYKIIDGKVKIISEDILKRKYPETYKYLLAIKEELKQRDKGNKKYETWYAYGRNQGLTNKGKMILTPLISLNPRFVICRKEDTLFYGGYAIYYNGNLEILSKILNSNVMDYYIKKTSKNYREGWKSYSKTFIKNFSIPNLTEKQKEFLKKENDKKKIDNFLMNLYNIKIF